MLANLYWPDFLKTSFRLEEQVRWKGGTLAVLFKNKGLAEVCDDYRDVLVSDFVGKCSHRKLSTNMILLQDRFLSTRSVAWRSGAQTWLLISLEVWLSLLVS